MAIAYILEPSGLPLSIIEDYNRLEWTRDYYKPGSFRLDVNFNLGSSKQIQKGNLVAPQEQDVTGFDPDAVYLIEQIERNIDENGKQGEIFNVSGRSVGGIFEERLILPASGQEFDTRTGPAETVMKGYVNANVGPGAAATRKLTNLTIASDLGRGSSVTYQGRYQTVAQMLEELALISGVGWEVTYDSMGQFQFDVIPGVDRTVSSGTPVFFDVGFDTIRSLKWLQSDIQTKSFAYVGGKGEGVTRPIVTTFTGGTEPQGFDRREIWVDAQDLDNTTALQDKGRAELADKDAEDVVEVEVHWYGSFRYRRDWDLGDTVTVRRDAWGLLVEARIIGVTNTSSSGQSHMDTTVHLSNPWPTLVSRVNDIRKLSDAGRRI